MRLVTDISKCLVCQKITKSKVWNATPEGIEKFCNSAKIRQDETFKRLENELNVLKENHVLWHLNCYKSYTSKRNLDFSVRSKTDNPSAQTSSLSEQPCK